MTFHKETKRKKKQENKGFSRKLKVERLSNELAADSSG